MINSTNIENLNNTVIWNNRCYQLVDIISENGSIPFDPKAYGFVTIPICSDCQSGYYCTFEIDNDIMNLTKLNIMTADEQYLTLNGVEPVFCSDDHSREYRNLRHAIGFTGVFRIGRGRMINAFHRCGSLGPGHLLELWDLEFSDGHLVKRINQMDLAAQQVVVQEQIFEYIATHDPGKSRANSLLMHCSYRNKEGWQEKAWDHPDQHIFSSIKTIFRMFKGRGNFYYLKYLDWNEKLNPIPFFESLRPDLARSALAIVKNNKNTPSWFIAQYGDSGLSQQLTFRYLWKLGVPYRLVRFMKKLVNINVTEKMVILEFLESMLLTVAAGHWEERVTPGHLYTNANIPAEVTASIRKRLLTVTLDSWG